MGLAYWIAQAIGPVTTVLSIVSAQFKKLKAILISEFVANTLVALSYILQGAFSGSYTCLVASAQTAISYIYACKKIEVPKWLTLVFIPIYIVFTVFSYKSLIDILPGICAVFFALAVVQKKAAGYRIYMGSASLLWFVYDIIIGAYGMMLTHGLLLISVAIAMVRHDIKKAPEEKNEEK